MHISRRRLSLTVVSLGTALSPWHGAVAQDRWPSKPIVFIVPFASGGANDILSRMLAPRLSEQLGQPVVVENTTGASGTIGLARLVRLPADGHSIALAATANISIGPFIYKEVGYDSVRDLIPIARLTEAPIMIFVRADSPYRSLSDLLAAARAKPGSITYGTSGIGGITHLGGELLARRAHVKLLHVPYRGAGPAMIAVLGGEVETLFTAPDAPMPHLRGGKLRALATMGYKRHRVLPDVPTVAESLPDIEEVTVWFGIVARAGLPAAVQQRLGAEAGRALAAPDVRERLAAFGQDSNFAGPEEFARIIASDIALWGPMIKSVGIRVE